MQWMDVVLFGVIVMVGYGFARMGFRLCSRPAVEGAGSGRNAERNGTEGGAAKVGATECGGQENFRSKLTRLVPGVFFAGFGMAIIWMAIDRYLPLVSDAEDDRPSCADAENSEVMGQVGLKVTVLRSSCETDESGEEGTSTTPRFDVHVEEVSLDGNSSGSSGCLWRWVDVAHHKPLPRPTLFGGNP